MGVALHRIAGVIYTGIHPRDVAALKVIVEECGGKVTNIHGDGQRYDQSIEGAITAHAGYHTELTEIVKKVL